MTDKGTQRQQWRYFFVGGKVHKLIRLSYSRDEIHAWCYDDEQVKVYQWSDVRRRGMRGFTFSQVSKMVHRTRRQILNYIYNGELKDPPKVLTPGTNYRQRIFSEEDVIKIQEIMTTKHRGRPRKDGMITLKRVPSRQEVVASVKHDMTLYVRTKDGKFVPLYLAEDW